MVSPTKLGCSNARNKGTCDNRLRFDRQQLETMVLNALRDHLMDDELCAEFCGEYTRRVNELRSQHNASLSAYRAEMVKLERETQQIIKSISEGVPGALLKDRAITIQNRKEELQRLLADVKEEPVLFHPNMASRYHIEIRNLIQTLGKEGNAEATTLLRSLVNCIVMSPDETGDNLAVHLIGDLAGILSIATNRKRASIIDDLSKVQPVQQEEEEGSEDAKTASGGGFALPMALVAGNRIARQFSDGPTSLALVAGGRLKRHFSQSSFLGEALVAGAGFEPAAFRL